MSSTKANSETRDPFDFYPTPEWCVHRFLEKADIPFGKTPFWIEPAAGSGAIIQAVGSYHVVKRNGITSLMEYKPNWVAVEIQPRFQVDLEKQISSKKVVINDFLNLSPSDFGVSPQVIITNPPFKLALDFLKKAMEHKPDYICFLLRLNFIAGNKERSTWMETHTPDLYILPNRPSFKANGKTDSIEYAWFVWRKDNNYGNPNLLPDASTLINPSTLLEESSKKLPKLVMLSSTPIEQRSRKRISKTTK